VYQLASLQGIQSVVIGTPILAELAGVPDEFSDAERAEQERLKSEFEERRGYWADLWHDIVAYDPEYFRTYMNFSSHPWDEGTLEPKVRELVYVAIDIVTTLLHEPGTRIHAENALEYGATREEIMEVFQIASGLGSHTFTEGIPILIEEAARRGKLPEPEE
jgi:alkylhydroperoxidase/carboxymuconolactone decarboxylase family protein YurZ